MTTNTGVSKNIKPPKLSKKLKPIDKVFIVTILAIPIVHFLIFYIYVNLQSFALAFQLPTGKWSTLTIQTAIKDIFIGSE